MEQMPAAVINGLIPCHVSLHVHVDAAGRSTPLSFTHQSIDFKKKIFWVAHCKVPDLQGV
jgi:hypothetical protein